MHLLETVTTNHKKSIWRIAFSADGGLFASASFDGTVCIFVFTEGLFDCVNVVEGHESEVKHIDWHP